MKPNKTVIGITGGIGTGKSTVLRFIKKKYEADLIVADEVGHALMEKGECVYKALVKEFGTSILKENGAIDKKKLAKLTFSSDEMQEKVDRIEHPLILEEIKKCVHGAKQPIVFIEAALLQEGKLTDLCDQVWIVTADKKTRVERLMADRKYTEEKCEAVMNLQLSEEEYLQLGTEAIENSGDFKKTKKRIKALMKGLGAKKRKS